MRPGDTDKGERERIKAFWLGYTIILDAIHANYYAVRV